MNHKQLSSLTRTIDFNYSSNVLAIALIVIGGVIGLLLRLNQQDGLVTAFWSAVLTGGSAFGAWIIGRELDPDHSGSAGVAGVVVLISAFFHDIDSNLIAMTAWIFVLRLLTRSTGIPYTRLDGLIILGCILPLLFTDSWLIGVIVSLSFFADSFLLTEPRIFSRIDGIAALLVTIIGAAVLQNFDRSWSIEIEILAAIIGIGIVFLILMLRETPTSPADFTGITLSKDRVNAGQIFAVVGAIAVFLWVGDERGVYTLLPLWGAISGISLYAIYRKLSGRGAKS